MGYNVAIDGPAGAGKSTIAKSVFAAVNARKNIAGKIRNDQRQSIEDELEQWLEQNNDFDDIMLFFEAHEELTQHILEAYENEKWEKDEIYEKTKKIIKEYCADNILDTSDIEEPVEEIVRILNRNQKKPLHDLPVHYTDHRRILNYVSN